MAKLEQMEGLNPQENPYPTTARTAGTFKRRAFASDLTAFLQRLEKHWPISLLTYFFEDVLFTSWIPALIQSEQVMAAAKRQQFFHASQAMALVAFFMGCHPSFILGGERPRPMEYLTRGLVALETKDGVFLSWRMLGTDPRDVSFDLFRNGVRVNSKPLSETTNYVDPAGGPTDTYRLKVVGNSQETSGEKIPRHNQLQLRHWESRDGKFSTVAKLVDVEGQAVLLLKENQSQIRVPRDRLSRFDLEYVDSLTQDKPTECRVWPRKPPSQQEAIRRRRPALAYLEIPLAKPPTDKHVPGDMSVGDLDGDGQYELVFEWEGTEPWLEAVTLDGRRLWRIACGPNTRKNKLGFLVYDFDGDGRAEVACKTGPGTRDGTGTFLAKGPAATDDDSVILNDRKKHLLVDQAYITIFEGSTGEELATVAYEPALGPTEEMQANWGDSHGYRGSSIKAAVLHDSDRGPLLVFTRGIYTRIAMTAFTWNGEHLKKAWSFDTKGNPQYAGYEGMGNHSVAVGDVDNDGSDELIYGACAIDHDGTGLYTTGRGHGDTHALADHIPDRPGLEFYQSHENSTYGISMRDAGTGEIIWEVLSKADVGRAWAADVSPDFRGSECTSIITPNLDCLGKKIKTEYNPYNAVIYFDGDVQRDIRTRTTIDDGSGQRGRILTGYHYNASDIHSTKYDANLVADILGDWREEVVFRRNDNRAFLLFSSWIPTERKNPTLMHDPVYRMNVAVQNIGYNQPADLGYYFADGYPDPNITMLRAAPTP